MNVRLRNRRNAQPFGIRNLSIAGNVALGINHNRFTAALATDEVGILRQVRIGDLFEKHILVIFGRNKIPSDSTAF